MPSPRVTVKLSPKLQSKKMYVKRKNEMIAVDVNADNPVIELDLVQFYVRVKKTGLMWVARQK